MKFTSELRDATCQWDHTVLSATRQRWPPRLHPNRAGWYSIYRPRKDERLSWPSWLVTYRNRLPVHRRSPILVLTGSDVAQLRWSRPTRYHEAKPPTSTLTLHELRHGRAASRVQNDIGLQNGPNSEQKWFVRCAGKLTADLISVSRRNPESIFVIYWKRRIRCNYGLIIVREKWHGYNWRVAAWHIVSASSLLLFSDSFDAKLWVDARSYVPPIPSYRPIVRRRRF